MKAKYMIFFGFELFRQLIIQSHTFHCQQIFLARMPRAVGIKQTHATRIY